MEWGWRVPFILSAALVLIGLYVRVSLHETPVFAKVAKAGKQVKVPLGTLLSKHLKATILGTFIMLATYTLFYLMTVYSMTYGTAPQPLGLGYSRNSFLWMLMVAVIGFGVMVPIAGLLADAFGRRKTMIAITLLMIGFAFLFPPCWFRQSGAGDGLPAVRPEHHGADLWPDGRAAAGAVPYRSALYRRVVLLQRRVDPRRVRGALYRHLAGGPLRAVLRRHVPAAMAGLTLLALLLMKETRHRSL